MFTSHANTYGSPAKSSPRKYIARQFVEVDVATFDELRRQQLPETLLLTLLAIKALMGPRTVIDLYDPRKPDSSLYTRLELLRHRDSVTLQRHVAELRQRGLVETFIDFDNPQENSCTYLRLTLPMSLPTRGSKRAPFIRIDFNLMKYCRLLVRYIMPRAKQGWETLFTTWVALKRFENRGTGLCCPSYATLATIRGRCALTMKRHVRLLCGAGIIRRERQPFPTRKSRTRYRSNHYTLIAPSALFRIEQNEVVTTNIPNLIPNPNESNHILKKSLSAMTVGGKNGGGGCAHNGENPIPHPMWECELCGDTFEAALA